MKGDKAVKLLKIQSYAFLFFIDRIVKIKSREVFKTNTSPIADSISYEF